MKFSLAFLFVLLISIIGNRANAQYTTIPDANFAGWLSTNGLSGCMVGNQLDTTCTLVVTKTSLKPQNANIGSLSGIEYFDNLDTLWCGGNNLTSIPSLPGLVVLKCGSNQLTSLPSLPSVKELSCELNPLGTIASLPPLLESLTCYNDQLTSLPALPATLDFILAPDNLLTSLPTLPAGMGSLNVQNNSITVFPALPSGLVIFNCSNNGMTSLPPLPATVQDLYCRDNNLTALPAILPGALTNLDCSNNSITTFPAFNLAMSSLDISENPIAALPPLPTSLRSLNCSSTLIDTLPALPQRLDWLACSNNNLTFLPVLPDTMSYIDCSFNLLTSLPALPALLRTLDCQYNSLTTIPALTSTVKNLTALKNQLVSLPALPDTMDYLYLQFNPALTCLPDVKRVGRLRFDSTAISCKPNLISIVNFSIPNIASVPLCDIFNSNGCNFTWNITGSAYEDANSNCISESSENRNPNVKIKLLQSGNLLQETFTDASGRYTFKTVPGTYDYEVETTGYPFNVTCPPANNYTSVITAIDSTDMDMDFAVECKPGFDIGAISIVQDSGRIRPAAFSNITINCGDLSTLYDLNCASGVSGTVTITLLGPVSYAGPVSGALIPQVSGNVLTYQIADFGTVDMKHDFRVVLQTDTTALGGQQACLNVAVTPTSGDNNASNNIYTHCFTVVNSFDPNEKEVSPVSAIDVSEYWLTYTIHFQNTGTAPADNIYILDTLDANLAPGTLQLLAYSDEPVVQIIGNVVRFNFQNINLPDSTSDEPNSHGYVQYKVRRNTSLPIGAQISNTAYIYFDFNQPIVTNTTINTVDIVNDIDQLADKSRVSVYPNPFTSSLNIVSANTIKSVQLFDMAGREVYSWKENTVKELRTDLFFIKDGLYIMEVVTDISTERLKIIKR